MITKEEAENLTRDQFSKLSAKAYVTDSQLNPGQWTVWHSTSDATMPTAVAHVDKETGVVSLKTEVIQKLLETMQSASGGEIFSVHLKESIMDSHPNQAVLQKYSEADTAYEQSAFALAHPNVTQHIIDECDRCDAEVKILTNQRRSAQFSRN